MLGVTGASGALGRHVASGLLNLVDPADIVLTTRNPSALAFDVTGPRPVAAQDMAALAGSHVEVALVDDDAHAAELRGSGLPADVVQLLTSMGAATRRGFLADASEAVATLSGRTATPPQALLSHERD